MDKFTKKPVTIQAVQWTGKNLQEVISFTDGPPDVRSTHAGEKWEDYEKIVSAHGLKIYTLEGKMTASVGDWIIKGVRGEFYPCKPDIFEETYSSASDKKAFDEAAEREFALQAAGDQDFQGSWDHFVAGYLACARLKAGVTGHE